MAIVRWRSFKATSRRGLGLLETLLAVSLLLLLLVASLVIFQQGLAGVHQVTARNALVSDLHWLSRTWDGELRSSSRSGLELASNGTGMALISALDTEGQTVFDALSARRVWQSYRVYWLNSAGEIRFRVWPLSPTDSQRFSPSLFSLWLGSSLEGSFSVGQFRIGNVQRLKIESQGPGLVQISLVSQRARYGSARPETAELRTCLQIRNSRGLRR